MSNRINHIIVSDDDEDIEEIFLPAAEDDGILITGSRELSSGLNTVEDDGEEEDVVFISETTRPTLQSPEVSASVNRPHSPQRLWARIHSNGQTHFRSPCPRRANIGNSDGRISSRIRVRPRSSRGHNSSNNVRALEEEYQHFLTHHYRQLLSFMPGIIDFEQQNLINALQESAQMDNSTPRLELQDLRLPQIPSVTRPGYTRGINKQKQLICPMCDIELGIGIPESDKDLSITEGDRLLSKRIFFARCGHTYCGRCVNKFLNRERKKRGVAKACVVTGCDQTFKKQRTPFREIYY